MCESCKHVYIADQAISALSAIDPEAIKRACADAACNFIGKHGVVYMLKNPDEFVAAILQAEPGRE